MSVNAASPQIWVGEPGGEAMALVWSHIRVRFSSKLTAVGSASVNSCSKIAS